MLCQTLKLHNFVSWNVKFILNLKVISKFDLYEPSKVYILHVEKTIQSNKRVHSDSVKKLNRIKLSYFFFNRFQFIKENIKRTKTLPKSQVEKMHLHSLRKWCWTQMRKNFRVDGNVSQSEFHIQLWQLISTSRACEHPFWEFRRSNGVDKYILHILERTMLPEVEWAFVTNFISCKRITCTFTENFVSGSSSFNKSAGDLTLFRLF